MKKKFTKIKRKQGVDKMDGKLDIDSFEKAINDLNKNLSDVCLLFRANMPLLSTDATQETKENLIFFWVFNSFIFDIFLKFFIKIIVVTIAFPK